MLDPIASLIQGYLGDLPVNIQGVFRACRVHEGLGIIFAAGTYAVVFIFSRQTIGFTGRRSNVPLEQIWR